MNKDVFFNVDANIEYNNQNQSSEEVFTTLVILENESALNDFIGSKNKENKNIKFLFSIENNDFYNLNNNVYFNVLDYESNLINLKIEDIENKFNSFLSIRGNDSKVHNLIIDKKNKYKDFIDTIEYDYNNNIKALEKNRFESILYNEVNKNEGFYFNNITNNFANNVAFFTNSDFDSDIQSNLTKIRDLEDKENVVSILDSQVLSNNLINIQNKIFNINTCNDIVTQVITNLSKSFYTLSNNSFLGNYTSNNKISISYNLERYKVLTSDREDINLFKDINTLSSTLDTNSIISKFNQISLSNNYESIIVTDTIVNDILESSEYYLDLSTRSNFLSNINNFYSNNSWTRFSGINFEFENPNFSFERNLERGFVNKVKNIFFPTENFNFYNYNFNRDSDITSAIYPLIDRFTDLYNNNNVISADAVNTRLSPLGYLKAILDLQRRSKLKFIFINEKSIFNVTSNLTPVLTTETFINQNLILDKYENFNELDYKVKIDNLVKSLKRKKIKNKEISTKIFDDIIKNAKNYDYNKMVAYCKENTNESLVSLIRENSEAFDLLFTKDPEDETTIYSNTDLYTDHNIDNVNIKSIKNRKENNLSLNNNTQSIQENIKNLINNYYPQNCYFTTTTFYQKILHDLLKNNETFFNERNIDNQNCQALYLNLFSSNNNVETNYLNKKVIAKRFFKKALLLSNKSSKILSEIKPTDYAYDHERFNIEDYSESNNEDIEFYSYDSLDRYLNNILNTSQNLNAIKNSVYSLQNINDLTKNCNFESIKDINFHNKRDYFNDQNEYPDFLILGLMQKTNVYPCYSFFSKLESFRSIKNDSSLNVKIEKKNNILAEIISNENFITPTGNYFLDPEGLDITSSKDIKLRYTVENKLISNEFRESNSILYNSRNNINNYIEVVDLFDEVSGKNHTLFNNICKVIIQSLNLYSSEFNQEIKFESEEDIDSFILRNINFVENEVIDILELYSDLYLVYFKRLLRHIALSDISDNQYSDNLNAFNDIPIFGKIVKTEARGFENLLKDIDYVFEKIDESKNNATSIAQSDLLFSENTSSKIFTNFSKKIDNVYKSLYKSDLYQSYMFDVLNGFIYHQNKLNNLNDEDIEFKISNLEIYEKFISEQKIEKIKNLFFSNLFFSNLSKNLFLSTYKSSKIVNEIIENFESEDFSIYRRDFFNVFKDIKQQDINKARNISFTNVSDNLSSVYSSNNNLNFNLPSSFYAFGLKNKDLSNINESNVIKFTVNIIDKFNLNHVYLPDIFYFSPLLFDVDNLFQNEIVNIQSDNSIGIYTPYESLRNKTKISNVDDILTLEESFIKNAIRKKITEDDSDIDYIYKHLIDCHRKNKNIKLFLKYMYQIKKDHKIEKDDFKNLIIENLNNKEFFNIFEKQKINIDKLDSNRSFEKVSQHLDSIFNISESIEDFFEVYFIPVNPESFIYYDIGENNTESSEVVEISDNYKILLSKEINTDFSSDRVKKTTNINLENISIDIKVEIL